MNNALIKSVAGTQDDFEWYPTTDEIINLIKSDIQYADHKSMLDCGAGDGRVLKKIGIEKKYAIEKSRPLLDSMDKDIFIIGTEFTEQTLIDKKVDMIFCNPPYSEFEVWTTKIIVEAHAKDVYLVIPQRWAKSDLIASAIKRRDAKASVLGSFDFLNADRRARAKVDVVRVDLSGYDQMKRDPFNIWFEDNFKIDAAKNSHSSRLVSSEVKAKVKQSVKNELVNGRDLAQALESLYQADLAKLINTYKSLEHIDADLLREMNVNLVGVLGALKLKIAGLKVTYWNELFNNLDQITNRLTSDSRDKLFATLNNNTHVDFSASNAYAVVIWVIKNSNEYFNSQLIKTFELLTDHANIALYKSNQKTFGVEDWRYCAQPQGLDNYALEYRVVLDRCGGIHNGSYRYDNVNGLSQRAATLLNDLTTIASNLYFDCDDYERANSFDWVSGKKNEFCFKDLRNGSEGVLMEVKAFKNGNLHIKFNQKFIKKLNVEFGRLKGWIKSAQQAASDLDISEEEAAESFNSNLMLGKESVLSLGFDRAA